MKFAIVSDTHFGDDTCVLVAKNPATGLIAAGPKYAAFKDGIGQDNDFLILAGDIFDFSIASYETAYDYGREFFRRVKHDNLAREIIYLAGNHDADIWHIIQHQRNVINRLSQGLLPQQYDHSVAGIIDDRTESPTKGFWLNKVTPLNTTGVGPKYGNMFLDTILGKDDRITFNFAYPNLYIVTDQESVLVTHGQYLEPYWAILGEFSLKVAYDDLKVGDVDIEEMVEMNFPLNQLACTGLGQAGVLTKVVRMVQQDVKNKDLKRIGKYISRSQKVADDIIDYGWLVEKVTDFFLNKGQEKILEFIGNIEATRYNEEFMYKQEVRERFKNYYKASLLEIGAINDAPGARGEFFKIPAPWRIIFGHTHQPIAWNDPDAPKLNTVSSSSPKRLTLHNTGGWLCEKQGFCGAEIFKYETGKGFSSISIT